MKLLKNTRALFCATGLMFGALLTACGGGSDGRDPILGVDAATVASVAVTPASATIQTGASQQFVATATYTDGTLTAGMPIKAAHIADLRAAVIAVE